MLSSAFFRTLRDDRELHIHPNSVLYGEKPPKWSVHDALNTMLNNLYWNFSKCIWMFKCNFFFRVVFNEVVQTSKYFMRDVTAVESSWLVELAPHFYKQAKVGYKYTTGSVYLLLCFSLFPDCFTFPAWVFGQQEIQSPVTSTTIAPQRDRDKFTTVPYLFHCI